MLSKHQKSENHVGNKQQKKSDNNIGKKSHKLNQTVARSLSTDTDRIRSSQRHQKFTDVFIEDVYEKAQCAKNMLRGKTGIVYDLQMVKHRCMWYSSHIECPERFTRSLARCEELGLIERCQPVNVRQATQAELLTVHSQAHIDRLALTGSVSDLDELEQLASKFDSIYIHPETYELALLAAGSTIQLVDEVCRGTVQNGMAIVRPPGHHAMQSEFCGFCYFNNVAIAAHHALDTLSLKRILIVDWDVHHGQATQQMFYNDPRVVYFSVHRYEHGEFWPNLRESDYDYVGEGRGAGFNFNVPLNTIGLGNADYMAIFHQLLLPMAIEFQPELIIISAGYDAAIGCPEGEMTVSPACYAHLVSSLMGLASGKIAVILEGGYCLRSLAEGVALTLRALLGDPCPNLPPLNTPSNSIQESILNCIYSHRPFWHCFQSQSSFPLKDYDPDKRTQHLPKINYNYNQPKVELYPTRDCCPIQTQEVKDNFNQVLDILIAETKLLKPKHEVCFVYDPLMMEHSNMNDPDHPEKPRRIKNIYEKHLEYNLLDRLHLLKSRFATREELLLVHDEDYLNKLEQLCASTENMTNELKRQLDAMEKKDSVYFHPQSYITASLAAGCLLQVTKCLALMYCGATMDESKLLRQVVDSVMQGESKTGVAVIRPPGHHAESYQSCGFCLFNNVSIAAKYAIKNYGVKRILILDWDVHHGNGTQRIFLSDPQVLYISVHRYDRGNFFPCSPDAAASVVGSGPGVGFNVNIPWNQKGMGNAEYIAAFLQVILPIAYQYSPDLVLVSAGFDAAVGDPLGGCKVSPETYGLLTSWLAPLAMGRLILCLEGGYNLTSISYAMTICTKTLLGDPLPPINLTLPLKPSASTDLRTVLNVQGKYWSSLCFNKDLPKEDVLSKLTTNHKMVSSPINDELLSKMSNLVIQDDSINVKDNIDSNVEQASSTYKNKINFTRVPSEWKQHVTQVPNRDNNNDSCKTPVSDREKPGPSQEPVREACDSLLLKLEALRQELGIEEGIAVYPSLDCPHLPAVAPVPTSGIDVSSPCLQCLPDPCATVENWICLTCYSVFCGRVIKEHMILHSAEHSHPIVLGFLDLSVWCYECNYYIDSPILYDAKNAAHQSKFGETMVNIYVNNSQN